MSIVTTPADRGDPLAGSSQRHREKVIDSIKNNLTDIIADESIIEQDRGKIIKIPIRTLKEHRFVFGPNNSGVGQGDVGEGDAVGMIPSESDDGSGIKPGDKPGVDYYEAEVTLGDILDQLFANLELPDLVKKALTSDISPDWELKRFQRTGPPRRMARWPTHRAHMRTKAALKGAIRLAEERQAELEAIVPRTAEEQDEYERIIEFLNNQEILQEKLHEKMGPGGEQREFLLPIRSEDFRFWRADEVESETHNAAIYLVRDVSGSMSTMERFLSRTFFFFCVKFIMRKYPTVKIIYISHDTEAQEIKSEQEFFTKGSSGGTKISPAYALIAKKMEDEYNPLYWDNYVVHASDGDNWEEDNPAAMQLVSDLCEKVKLFTFVQTTPGRLGRSSILEAFVALQAKIAGQKPLIAARLKSVILSTKEDVWTKFEECFRKQLVGGY